jgi:hypothetical protein
MPKREDAQDINQMLKVITTIHKETKIKNVGTKMKKQTSHTHTKKKKRHSIQA